MRIEWSLKITKNVGFEKITGDDAKKDEKIDQSLTKKFTETVFKKRL